jgi:hypothetical protein
VINALRERASALVIGWSLAAVAASTGFISYTHISALTVHLNQSWKSAHLYPLCVDGQIAIGTVILMEVKSRHRWWGLIGFLPGLGESLVANWASGWAGHPAVMDGHRLVTAAQAPNYGAALWATVPAQAFACSTFLFEMWLRYRRQAQAAAAKSVTETIPEAAPPVPEPAAPAAPAGAGPLGLPVPEMGPVRSLADRPVPGWIKTEQAAARTLRRATAPAAPAAGDDRRPLPSGAELAALLGDPEVSANEMARRYAVGRWTANQMKKQYASGELVIEEEVKDDASAA